MPTQKELSDSLDLKIKFCQDMNIAISEIVKIDLLFAPPVITYNNRYYSYVDTILCVLIKNDKGEYLLPDRDY